MIDDELARARRRRSAQKSLKEAEADLRALAASYNLAADELIQGTLTRSPADLMVEAATSLKSLETYREDELGSI